MSSDPLSRPSRAWLLSIVALLAATSAAAGPTSSGGLRPITEVLLTQKEALELAFPECKVERRTHYLDEEQRKVIAKKAGVPFESAVAYSYRATRKDQWVGTAYFDTHRVRSLRETLMVVVAPNGTVARIEVLSFAEPKDYLPRKAFYEQFEKRPLDDELQLNRKIRNVTGATLTSRATTSCARRVLALHTFLTAKQQDPTRR